MRVSEPSVELDFAKLQGYQIHRSVLCSALDPDHECQSRVRSTGSTSDRSLPDLLLSYEASIRSAMILVS